MLQMVGESCPVCSERLRSESGAGACAACEIAFHVKCADNSERCPECGEPWRERWETSLAEQERVDALARRKEGHRQSRRRAGRATLGVGAGMLVSGLIAREFPLARAFFLIVGLASVVSGLIVIAVYRDRY